MVKQNRAVVTGKKYMRQQSQLSTHLCARCKVVKDRNCYLAHPTNKSGLQAYCKQCMHEHGQKYFNSDKGFVMKMANDAASSSKSRRLKGREMGPFSFAVEDIEVLHADQGGLCALSGIPVVRKMHSNWQESPDRIDTSRDYTRGNVRLVAAEFNGSSQWTPEKVQYAFLTQHEADVAAVKEAYREALLKPKRVITRRNTIEHCHVGGIKKVKCNKCNEYKTPQHFYEHLNRGCKECQTRSNREYLETLRGWATMLVCLARGSAKAKVAKGRVCRVTLTVQQILRKYLLQQGLCWYSNIPMCTKRGDWRMSLERINPTGDYSNDNTCLVCHEFNVGDHRSTIRDETTGERLTDEEVMSREGCFWSQEKFVFAQMHIMEKYGMSV
ncbi:hypothetical protein JKP88DRAFT_244826 [Tribonema minus]|uniref:Uncharacterized protein n=1 Tax=Tribonema minus TaxID=303371 RepID=A0A836CFS8_9STRA|nr:hypothetical protein JKP88DRAFT_244826 [Tribonema minus]